MYVEWCLSMYEFASICLDVPYCAHQRKKCIEYEKNHKRFKEIHQTYIYVYTFWNGSTIIENNNNGICFKPPKSSLGVRLPVGS